MDHFKPFNDHYGHQAGDDCLRAVARALRHTLWRPGDAVARYGGEEFACILPDTDLEGALMVAQRMTDAVHALGLAHETSTTDQVVTISAGVAVLSPGPGGTPSELVALADEQLYKAKAGGRAQVCGLQGPAPATLKA